MHRGRKQKKSRSGKGRCQQIGERHEKNASTNASNINPTEQNLVSLPNVLEVKHSDIIGRYLVTTRDVKAGEVLLGSEESLVSGPCQGGRPALCLGCNQPLSLPLRLGAHCLKCGWPMCSTSCPKSAKHHAECELLCIGGSVPIAPELLDERPELYNAIVPLRCLYLRDNQPEKWKIIMTMEAHNDIRRARPTIWRTNQEYVVTPIRELWCLEKQFTELEIHTVCGVLEVNAFEIGPRGQSVRALFPRAFLMAHDCTPNTCHTDDSSGKLHVRASTNIPAGQSITLSYAYTLQGTLKRRQHLREGKFFDCVCKRCTDPTELETYCSALLCPRCGEARVLSTNPLNEEADWQCFSCNNYTVCAKPIQQLLERLGEEAEILDPNNIPTMETFIKKYQKLLPPSHYLLLGVKHSLSQVYGKIAGYLINDLTNEQLKHKRDICREILPIFDILEPGMSRLRGVTLYELHAPIMILASRASESRSISKVELQNSLKEVASCLEKSSLILRFEPEGSEEKSMSKAAAQALQQVTEWRRRIANSK